MSERSLSDSACSRPPATYASPAGLGAQAPVSAAPAEHGRHQALAGYAHAQRTVHEQFELQRALLVYLRNFGGRQLARQYHAREAEPFEHLHAGGVMHAHLRGCVQGQFRTDLPRKSRGGEVLYNQRVGACR